MQENGRNDELSTLEIILQSNDDVRHKEDDTIHRMVSTDPGCYVVNRDSIQEKKSSDYDCNHEPRPDIGESLSTNTGNFA